MTTIVTLPGLSVTFYVPRPLVYFRNSFQFKRSAGLFLHVLFPFRYDNTLMFFL